MSNKNFALTYATETGDLESTDKLSLGMRTCCNPIMKTLQLTVTAGMFTQV